MGDKRDGFWSSQKNSYCLIYGADSGNFQDFVSGIPQEEVINTFNLGKPWRLSCMDDRQGVDEDAHKYRDIRLPGSGLLHNGKDISMKDHLDHAERLLKKKKISVVTSHCNCGAAEKSYDNLTPAEKEIYADSNSFGTAFAQELAKRLSAEYAEITDMVETEFHPTRFIYLDTVGGFNPRASERLPEGFVISYLDEKQAESDVRLAVDIILSEHGFHERINEYNPIVVVPIGNKYGPSVDELKEKLRTALNGYGKNVLVDGFTTPSNMYSDNL